MRTHRDAKYHICEDGVCNNYRNYYTDETRELVTNIYKKDLELFNYEF